MKELGLSIIKATNEAMELGLDIREVYITEWSGDKESIDYVQVTVEHSVEGQDAYAKYHSTQRF